MEREGKRKEAETFARRTLEQVFTEHFRKTPELLEVICKHPDWIWPFSAWIAIRSWTSNKTVYRWLTEEVIPKALQGFRPRLPVLSREDLTQEGYAALADALPAGIPRIRKTITAYLSAIIRNAAKAHLKEFPVGESLDQPAYPEGEETAKDMLKDPATWGNMERALLRASVGLGLERAKKQLTLDDLFLLNRLTTPKTALARELGISVRQLFRRYSELKNKIQKTRTKK
jgi:DNA-directed RNA polymerase specialized sigma24 family protein